MAVVGTFHHVHMISKDPEAVAAWFARWLGAEVVQVQHPSQARNLVMRVGEAIFSARTPRPSDGLGPADGPRPKGYGIHHFCLVVDDLKGLLGEMRKGGVNVLQEMPTHVSGHFAAFVEGPEQMPIELIQA